MNSDEVLCYADGDFMSRLGVDQFDLSLHPSGLPHGPYPGTTEASLGQQRTEELAVMLDTFRPLQVTRAATACEDACYASSWLGEGAAS